MDPHQIRSHEIASPGGPGEAISCGACPEIDAPTPPGEAISRQGGVHEIASPGPSGEAISRTP